MITIKQIQNNATVTDGTDTVTLGAGDSYTCSEPEEKLDLIFTVDIDTNIFNLGIQQNNNFLIDWGDGVEEYHVFSSAGTSTTIEHNYTTTGQKQMTK